MMEKENFPRARQEMGVHVPAPAAPMGGGTRARSPVPPGQVCWRISLLALGEG